MLPCVFNIFLYGLLSPLVASRHVDFFRVDYRYIAEFDAYYKIQWDMYGLSLNLALLNCRSEGAELFYPKLDREWTVAKNLNDTQCAVSNVTDIFVGVDDTYMDTNRHDDEVDYTTDTETSATTIIPDMESLSCVLMDIESGTFQKVPCARPSNHIVPYICKKVVETCPTVDEEYKYKGNKQCYKVHNKESTWLEAVKTCFKEGSVLAVPESHDEVNIMMTLMESQYKKYFVGYRKMDPFNKLYTVSGKELYDGYIFWTEKIYNQYTCGMLLKNGNNLYTELVDCNNQLHFICRMNVP